MSGIVDQARERQTFESVYSTHNLSRHLHFPDNYADSHINAAWAAWLAAKQDALPRWIPVSEKLPESGQSVLVAESGARHADFCTYWARSQYPWDAGDDFFTDVTHWMELPEPPKPPGEAP